MTKSLSVLCGTRQRDLVRRERPGISLRWCRTSAIAVNFLKNSSRAEVEGCLGLSLGQFLDPNSQLLLRGHASMVVAVRRIEGETELAEHLVEWHGRDAAFAVGARLGDCSAFRFRLGSSSSGALSSIRANGSGGDCGMGPPVAPVTRLGWNRTGPGSGRKAARDLRAVQRGGLDSFVAHVAQWSSQ